MKFDFQKILEVAKKNWASIALGVLMLIAFISVFTIVSSQRAALQTSLDERKKVYDDLDRLLHKTRHAPVVSINPDAAAPELGKFPNPPIIKAGEEAIARVGEQSLALKTLAVRMNAHKPLVPGSLPGPTDGFRFQRIYLEQFSKVIPATLQSATPPTEEEIKGRADELTAEITKKQPHTDTGAVYNPQALQQQISEMLANLPAKMRQDAANNHRLYMAPSALSIHPVLAGGTGQTVMPDAEHIWLAQVGLWVQQDVIDAVARLNANSKVVADSPVKQIVQIYVAPDRSLYVMPGAPTGGAPAAPAVGGAAAGPASPIPTNSETDPLPKDYSVSPTGRVCNGVFDVVHFYVVLNVQAVDLERVIRELEQNRLITVYQVDVTGVNSAAFQQIGYFFGKNPVVTVTLNCEELMLRDWTQKMMPPEIKRFLNVGQQPGAPDAGQPTAATY